MRLRAPVVAVFAGLLAVCLFLIHSRLIAAAVLVVGILALWGTLRYALGWPWSRVLRWEEPGGRKV